VEAIFTKILNYFPPKCEKVFPLLIDLDMRFCFKREQQEEVPDIILTPSVRLSPNLLSFQYKRIYFFDMRPPHPPLSPLGRGLRRELSRTDGVRGDSVERNEI
jgi:hypothetical protein